MRASIRLAFVLLALLACVASISSQECTASADAARVLGQASFTVSTGTAITAPIGVAVSPDTGKVIVSQETVAPGSPVLARFASTTAMIEEQPEGYFANLVSVNGTCNETTLRGAANRLHIDFDNLFVSDSEGNRVVILSSVSTVDLTNFTFSQAVGVVNASVDCPSAPTITNPQGLYLDYVNDDGGLWVATNEGVAKFSTPNQAIPDGFVGVPGETCTATSIQSALSVAIDPSGSLWVADTLNNRVLGFGNASTLALDGNDAAIVVFGQTGFTTCTAPATISASSLNLPTSLAFDDDGTLFINDAQNYRILIIANSSTAITATGGQADFQLGQADFSTGVEPNTTTADTFAALSIDYDFNRTHIVVADTTANRVLGFCVASAPNVTASVNVTSPSVNVTSVSVNETSVSVNVSSVSVNVSSVSVNVSSVSVNVSSVSVNDSSVSVNVSSVSVNVSSVSVNVSSGAVNATSGMSVSAAVPSTGVPSTGVPSTVSSPSGAVNPSPSGAVNPSPSGAANPSQSGVAPSAAVTPSKVVVCGDGSKDLYEQCDPPSVIGCCNKDCRWAPIDQVCAAAEGPCYKERRCAYQNTIVRTGRQCGPGGLKAAGSRCSDYNPLKKCTATGVCQ